jgi:DNA-binding NtrC family response regulator
MTETRQLVIVRRNQVATFAMLAQAFADEPAVRLIWDRRLRDRRQAPTPSDPEERRRRERRSRLLNVWERHDYLVLSVAQARTVEAIEAPAHIDAQTFSLDVSRDLEAAVRSDMSVLISGGDPVSRKSLAQQIHRRSDRGAEPLVVVQPHMAIEFFETFSPRPALTRPLVSAGTRETLSRSPIEGGTVLIEEVADLSLAQQGDLMMLVEHGAVRNDLRSHRMLATRVISATGHWLLDRVAAKQFRADLFYRLNAIHLVLPPGLVRRLE